MLSNCSGSKHVLLSFKTKPALLNCLSTAADVAGTQVEVYALRIRSFYDRIRPYFGVLHDPVLRSYFSVTVYGEIQCETVIVYGLHKRGS